LAFAQTWQARLAFGLRLPNLGKLAWNPVCVCPKLASPPENQFALAQTWQARVRTNLHLPKLG